MKKSIQLKALSAASPSELRGLFLLEKKIKNNPKKHPESISVGFLSLLSRKIVLQLTVVAIRRLRRSTAEGRSFCYISDKLK